MNRASNPKLSRRRALIGACALPPSVLAAPVLAQEWPSRPVRFIVPFPAGGSTDVVGRLLAEMLRDGCYILNASFPVLPVIPGVLILP